MKLTLLINEEVAVFEHADQTVFLGFYTPGKAPEHIVHSHFKAKDQLIASTSLEILRDPIGNLFKNVVF
jgi:hypothetical protein